ncbi:YceI family protein [Halomonas sp. 18H]|uniref:YceI family protein n=1 Tax=Halomonas almeriensis TaxID=308163 RepID=UPI002230256E|nr:MULTISPECIES: YceI family protein [Halomonas]MCW4153046.1 YceI family protein [Halomonas sp. 18H]MDN3554263.1 YceI family protein [Halomonas almeriensis]
MHLVTPLPSLRRDCRIPTICVMAVLLAIPTSGAAEPRTYRIDPDHFAVSFSVAHVGYADVLGQFLEASGEFVYDESSQELISGSATIDAASVFTNHEARDAHVRDDDFLDTEAFPTIAFVAESLTDIENQQGTLNGQLTLLGQTRPVSLDVTLNKAAPYPFGHEKHTLGISATTTLERSQWGMDYAVDNGLVGDEVDIRLEFEAIRQPPD